MSEHEDLGTADPAPRSGKPPRLDKATTSTDVNDPERSSQDTVAGSGIEPHDEDRI